MQKRISQILLATLVAVTVSSLIPAQANAQTPAEPRFRGENYPIVGVWRGVETVGKAVNIKFDLTLNMKPTGQFLLVKQGHGVTSVERGTYTYEDGILNVTGEQCDFAVPFTITWQGQNKFTATGMGRKVTYTKD